jgi:hypothetical protein
MLLTSLGCGGPKLVDVTGTITVDGRPAEGAALLFHPESGTGSVSSGVANSEGKFSLVSNMEKGVLPGRYKVTVIWPDPSRKPTETQIMMGTAEPGPDLLKGRYASKDKSGLTAEIVASSKALPPFELNTK